MEQVMTGIATGFFGIMTLFAPLAFQLVILSILASWLQILMARVLGFGLSVYLTAPGTIIHELSHFLGCIVAGTSIGEVSLFSPREDPPGSGRWVLGQVVRGKTSYLGEMVISFAPFFGCTAALIVAIKVLLPGSTIPSFPYSDLTHIKLTSVSGAFSFLFTYIATYITYLVDFTVSLNLLDLRTYLFILITLSIAPGITPSATDYEHFFSALAVTMLLLLPVTVIFHLCGFPFLSISQKEWGNALIDLSTYIGMATIICLLGVIIFLIADGVKSLAQEKA